MRDGSSIKRVAGWMALLLTLALPMRSPEPLLAQAPDEAWRTLTTEHFRVTFPERLEVVGRRAAERSERAWSQLEEAFIEPPGDRIDVLITDHADVSNGFAQVTPSNRITVFARPPADQLSLGYMDEWLELVITHELAHIIHLDHVRNPIGRVARAVFGRVSAEWPFFPELGTPRWVIEGLATWYESDLSSSGRVLGTFHEMQMRTAVLEGRFEDIGQAAGESPLWPGGNRPYAYGSMFFDFLLKRHGPARMADFADAVAGQWVPYRLDSAGRDAFGVSLTAEWEAWADSLEVRYSGLEHRLERLMPVTRPEQLTRLARWGLNPAPSPSGRWVAYTRSDGRSDIQLRVRDPESGEDRSVGRTNGLSTFSWLPDSELLVSQLELEGPYRLYGDLYVFDLEGGERRLTHGARLTQPSATSDGSVAVAIQEGEGTNAVVRVDLRSLDITPVVSPEPDVHWAFPRVSPNGRWIAATRWEPDAHHDVVVLDSGTGEIVQRITDDRALDMGPAWSADGRWLVWASDRTGIPNILAAEVDPATGRTAAPRLMTNVLTGAAYPALDPSGRWLYFSGHHVDGWEVERVPFTPQDAPLAPPAGARFVAEPGPQRGASGNDVEGYSPLPTLGPTYWEISYADPVDAPAVQTDSIFLRRRELLGFGLGMQTSGRDLVGRHAYSAYARFATSGDAFEGGLSYSYAGLGNPVLSVTANQTWGSGRQGLSSTADRDTLFVLERERLVEGAVTILAPTYRRNLALTLSAGMIWEHLSLLEVDLQPSSEYRPTRPSRRYADFGASLNFNSSRTHSFQMGTARGLSAFVRGRVQNELSVPDSLPGTDRSVREVYGRVRGALPLGGGGFATHVIAVQASGGIASGPGAGPFYYRVGGASGRSEDVTGLELFGGNAQFFPARGYDTSSRTGRYAWAASAEYRFPLWLVNQGFRAWPFHVDRAIGSVFFDAGNAWGPEDSPGQPIASVGAEVTSEFLLFYDIQLRLRLGYAFRLVQGTGDELYLRVGLPF